MPSIELWSPDSWDTIEKETGKACVHAFEGFVENNKFDVQSILDAYNASHTETHTENLERMKAALGCPVMEADNNYGYDSYADAVLTFTLNRGDPDHRPPQIPERHDFVKYDHQLRKWVAPLKEMHSRMIQNLQKDKVENEDRQRHVYPSGSTLGQQGPVALWPGPPGIIWVPVGQGYCLKGVLPGPYRGPHQKV